MRDDSLIRIISGADPADPEDVYLRASLALALCRMSAEMQAEIVPEGHETASEPQAPAADDDAAVIVPLADRRAVRARLHYGWAIAASLVAAVTFGGGVMWGGTTPSERADLLDEVAGYHAVYSRETTHLVEIPAGQTEQLTAWLGERLDRDLKVPDLAAAGLSFAGGRMLVINDRPVAELMYTREHGLPVAVCVSRIDGAPWSMGIEQHGALRIASWGKDAYAYVVVGELDETTAKDLAQRVAAQI